jgi:hypothetical protein
MSIISNMALVQTFEVIYDRFNILKICSNGNYAQKWVTKQYACLFIVHAGFIIQAEAFEGKLALYSPNFLFIKNFQDQIS